MFFQRFLGSLKMGRVPEADTTEDYDSGDTGDTALQGARSPRAPRAPQHAPCTPLSSQPLAPAPCGQGPLPSGLPPGYGATDKAEVEVIMNSSKACDGDIARL